MRAEHSHNQQEQSGETVIPVIAEELHIDKEWREKNRVRLIKEVEERTVPFTVDLLEEQAEVVRVPINEPVEVPPAVRYEGSTTIIPVLKEEYMIVKKLVLVEEIRITKRHATFTHEQTVMLRSERVDVERQAK